MHFRKRGHKTVVLPQPIGSDEFWQAYKAALGDKIAVGAELRSKAGSISAALAAYLSSTAFTGDDLSDGTRSQRRPILERFRERYGEHQLRHVNSNFISAYLESMKPHAARNHLKTLRGFLRHAKHDVTAGIVARAKSKKHPSWTPELIAQFEAHHAIGTKPRLCFALAKCTGAGRNEITELGPHSMMRTVNGEVIVITRKKTKVTATMPVLPELRAIIDATPITGLSTFLVTKTGKKYAPNDLSDEFRQWCTQAGIPNDYSLHGLRHTMGDTLADHGATAHQVAAVLGQKDIRSALHYTQGADRKRLAHDAMAPLMMPAGGTN